MDAIFDFSYFPVLETERLRLRQITHADADAIIGIFGSPDVLCATWTASQSSPPKPPSK